MYQPMLYGHISFSVEAVSGATFSSRGIIEAVNNALSKAN
jgi:uncharacterized protein with FMN-binding domain